MAKPNYLISAFAIACAGLGITDALDQNVHQLLKGGDYDKCLVLDDKSETDLGVGSTSNEGQVCLYGPEVDGNPLGYFIIASLLGIPGSGYQIRRKTKGKKKEKESDEDE